MRTKSAPARMQPQQSTAAAVPSANDGDPISIESLYRISFKQYHAVSRSAILTEEDPVELLEGLLVCKMSKNPPHVVATDLLQRAL